MTFFSTGVSCVVVECVVCCSGVCHVSWWSVSCVVVGCVVCCSGVCHVSWWSVSCVVVGCVVVECIVSFLHHRYVSPYLQEMASWPSLHESQSGLHDNHITNTSQRGLRCTAGTGSYSRHRLVQQTQARTTDIGSYSRHRLVQQAQARTADVRSYSRRTLVQQA